jgi:hypothetical protein
VSYRKSGFPFQADGFHVYTNESELILFQDCLNTAGFSISVWGYLQKAFETNSSFFSL